MKLHRLIYTSSRKPECSETEITRILESARKNNPAYNITGVLLHTKNRFLQYLEGDGDEIMGLYERIKGDYRHGGCMVRDFSPIEERIFPNWQMGYKDVAEDELQFNTDITAQDRKHFEALIEGQLADKEIKSNVVKRFFEVSV